MIHIALISALAIIVIGIWMLVRDNEPSPSHDNSGGYGKESTEKDDKPYVPDDVDHEQDSLID